MKRGFIYLIAVFVFTIVIAIVFVKPFEEKKYSNIVEKEVRVDGKVVAKYKIAEFPKKGKVSKKEPDNLQGRVVFVPNNPDDIYSKMMVAVKKDKEIIVVSNPVYVRTLGYLYFDRDVRLKGNWQKEAVIFGKKYKVFRIEDISLAE